MKFLLLWFRNFLNWLIVEPWLFWLGVLVTLIVLGVAVLWRTEQSFRISGGLFQLLGVGTVAWGIHETRILFGRPGIFVLWLQWLRRVPRWPRAVYLSGNINLGNLRLSAQGYQWRNVPAGAPLETRVEALEKNLADVNDRVDRLQSEHNNQFTKQAEELRTEISTRTKEISELRAKLETTETGGLNLSAFGVFWIVIGIIMTTISTELAQWLGRTTEFCGV